MDRLVPGYFIRSAYLINSETKFPMWRNADRSEKFTSETRGSTADDATYFRTLWRSLNPPLYAEYTTLSRNTLKNLIEGLPCHFMLWY